MADPEEALAGAPAEADARAVFVLVAVVPALLVVVGGYVLGYAVADWLSRVLAPVLGTTPSPASAEVAGWITGLVLLAVVVRLLVVRPRWLRRLVARAVGGPPQRPQGGGRDAGHQK